MLCVLDHRAPSNWCVICVLFVNYPDVVLRMIFTHAPAGDIHVGLDHFRVAPLHTVHALRNQDLKRHEDAWDVDGGMADYEWSPSLDSWTDRFCAQDFSGCGNSVHNAFINVGETEGISTEVFLDLPNSGRSELGPGIARPF